MMSINWLFDSLLDKQGESRESWLVEMVHSWLMKTLWILVLVCML